MKLLDLTLDSPAENLALDEALLDQAESSPRHTEILRLWELAEPVVVLGRSSRVGEEVNREACRRKGIPVYRRSSGGASVVAGPGCLMYTVLLNHEIHPALRLIDHAHCFVLDRLSRALSQLGFQVEFRGTSDLTCQGKKFSGNSMRCKRRYLLYHGTVLYDFPLELIGECLNMPPRQPDYRQGRAHADFLTNISTSGDQLRRAIRESWQAENALAEWPETAMRKLVDERYARDEWNFQF